MWKQTRDWVKFLYQLWIKFSKNPINNYMHCNNCGKKNENNVNFCIHCGKSISQSDKSDDSLFSINISNTKTLSIYDDHIRYNGEDIRYVDVDGVSYLLTRQSNSINLIPTHNSTFFSVQINTKDKLYTIDSSTTSFMTFTGKKEEEIAEIFSKIVYIIDNIIKDFVIVNLYHKYETEGKITIGDLTILPDGLYKKRSFWRKPEKLEWNNYYNAVLYKGHLQVLKEDKKKKYKLFTSISMGVLNAVILPEFLSIEFNKRSTKTIDTVALDNEGKFCPSCSGPVEANDTFCVHCGNKLII